MSTFKRGLVIPKHQTLLSPNTQTLYLACIIYPNTVFVKSFFAKNLEKLSNIVINSGKVFGYRNKVLKNSKNSVWLLFTMVIRGIGVFHLIPPDLQRDIRNKGKEPRQTDHMSKCSKEVMVIYRLLLCLIFKCLFGKVSRHNIYYIPCLGKSVWGS